MEQFLDELRHRGVPLNAKYQSLIALYGKKTLSSKNPSVPDDFAVEGEPPKKSILIIEQNKNFV